MNTVLHEAATIGQANHSWLKSNYTFSFGITYVDNITVMSLSDKLGILLMEVPM